MKNTMNKPAANSKGFSLVELLIVAALIGIMTAIGVPAMIGQMAHIRFTRDARDLSVAFRAARMNAIAKNVRYGINITQGAPDAYQVQTCTDSPAPAPSVACAAWGNAGGLITFSSNSDITSPAASIRVEFLPTGTAAVTGIMPPATNIDIRLANPSSDTDQLTINVRAATGKIAVT
ncbi:MAG: prepilin-type N-terminal cleavage/methylation domain-containing protein [Deltaproteobacteria bacterium]|nr:prepilin-type N-terminal cleavage/methylation domain-containing protein [Deltaproteobacteria bacterium]